MHKTHKRSFRACCILVPIARIMNFRGLWICLLGLGGVALRPLGPAHAHWAHAVSVQAADSTTAVEGQSVGLDLGGGNARALEPLRGEAVDPLGTKLEPEPPGVR
ncbi:MAG: hypothetical protein ACKOQP_00435 [Bacteroidota bacterium]